MSAILTSPITIGDLSTLKGGNSYLVLNPDLRKVDVTGAVGGGCGSRVYYGRDLLLGEVPESAVEDSLREWLQENMAEIEALAEGYLGSDWDHNNNRVGRWTEEAHEAAYAFRDLLSTAFDQGAVARTWDADDWCQGDWPGCEHKASRAGDLEDWASQEASDARIQGVHLDEDDLVRAMTARLTRKLADVGDAALVEWMPESLRESHAAAGNSGEYPHNGAERFVACRDEWEDLAEDEDEGQWVRIVRTATIEDLRVYGSR